MQKYIFADIQGFPEKAKFSKVHFINIFYTFFYLQQLTLF